MTKIIIPANIDDTAFAEIYNEHVNMIKHYVLTIVKNKEDAEDLTNEVFVKVYHNLNLYNPKLNFKSWLYKIATNCAIDFLRKKKTLPNFKDSDDNKLTDNRYNPEDQMEKDQNKVTLEQAISMIKPIYRTVLRMRYYRELSYEEIARKLSMPIGTVKAYLHRGKKALAEIIKNQEK